MAPIQKPLVPAGPVLYIGMMRLETAVDSFLSAALFPEQWPRALDAIADSMNSDGATLVLTPTRNPLIAFSASIDVPTQQRYFRLPFPDPREQRVSPGVEEGFRADHAYFSPREIAREPYYQEFLVPLGLGWHAAAALGGGLLLSLKRGGRRTCYGEAELAALNSALPSLRCASRAASLIWRSNLSSQLRVLERVDRGAILIDSQARVLEMNACVELGDGLDAPGGTLQAAHPLDRPRMQRFLAASLDPWKPAVADVPSVTLARPSGRRAWVLDAISCTDAMRSQHSRAAALILITDVERPMRLEQTLLRQMFGMTSTEARLAHEISCGHSLRQAAVHLSISEGHARQRLKAIFGKTGCCSQVALVALLAKLA